LPRAFSNSLSKWNGQLTQGRRKTSTFPPMGLNFLSAVPGEFGIRIIFATSPNNRAWFADGIRARRIICGSRNRVLWGEKRVMNEWCPCALRTIVRYMMLETSWSGGRQRA